MHAVLLRILLAVVVLVLATPGAALATIYDNRVCVDVDIAFVDDNWGTMWTDDTLDKAGRGFKVNVTTGTWPGLVQVWPPVGSDEYVAQGGSFAGCTDDIQFDSNLSYTITVWSEAKIDTVTLSAVDSGERRPPR